MFSFYSKDIKDSKPERALSVKQNSMDYCFVAKRCEDGYRMRQHWVVKQCKKSPIYCVLLPLPLKNGLNTTFKPFFLFISASPCGLIIHDFQHKTGIILLSVSFCLQRFRLLQHQNSIRIAIPIT